MSNAENSTLRCDIGISNLSLGSRNVTNESWKFVKSVNLAGFDRLKRVFLSISKRYDSPVYCSILNIHRLALYKMLTVCSHLYRTKIEHIEIDWGQTHDTPTHPRHFCCPCLGRLRCHCNTMDDGDWRLGLLTHMEFKCPDQFVILFIYVCGPPIPCWRGR